MRLPCLVRSVCVSVALVTLAGCAASPGAGSRGEAPSSGDRAQASVGVVGVPETVGGTTGVPASGPGVARAPGPDARLPRAPERLAERLALTTSALLDEVERWRASAGTAAWPPPRRVVLLALDQQRAIQVLAGRGDRREATIAALPRALRPAIRDAAEAGAALRAGLGRVGSDDGLHMRTRAPLPPDVLLGHYRDASRRFGVRWEMLAAVHFLETKFGRVVSSSWAGAQGPMQFIPSTWAAYGMGGNIRDPRDAIHGAANYLAANGAPHQPRRALWAYNPVAYYGEAVLRYERMMRRDPRMFYALYSWQVFVRTSTGVAQLTGPGADVRSSA